MVRNIIGVFAIAGAVFGMISIIIAGHFTFIPTMVVLISASVMLMFP